MNSCDCGRVCSGSQSWISLYKPKTQSLFSARLRLTWSNDFMPNVLFFSLFSHIIDCISLDFDRMYNFLYCFKIHWFICVFMLVGTFTRTSAVVGAAIGALAAINLGAKNSWASQYFRNRRVYCSLYTHRRLTCPHCHWCEIKNILILSLKKIILHGYFPSGTYNCQQTVSRKCGKPLRIYYFSYFISMGGIPEWRLSSRFHGVPVRNPQNNCTWVYSPPAAKRTVWYSERVGLRWPATFLPKQDGVSCPGFIIIDLLVWPSMRTENAA